MCVRVCVCGVQDSRYDVETTEKVGNFTHGGLIGQPPQSHHITLLHQRCTAEKQELCREHSRIAAVRETQAEITALYVKKIYNIHVYVDIDACE